MSEEPTVLDYVKALLTPWRGAPPPIPPLPKKQEEKIDVQPVAGEEAAPPQLAQESPPIGSPVSETIQPKPVLQLDAEPSAAPVLEIAPVKLAEADKLYTRFPWRTMAALVLALAAQWTLRPQPERDWIPGAVLYLLASLLLAWAYLTGEYLFPEPAEVKQNENSAAFRWPVLLAGLLIAAAAFFTLGGNQFTALNVGLWVIALILIIWAFWLPGNHPDSRFSRLKSYFQNPRITFSLKDYRFWLVLGVIVLLIFVRFYRLNQIPPEMNSDHAEKLWDVYDILKGEYRIFFPRNTGREAIQFYLTAAIIKVFGTGLTHLSLKLGTAFLGLITLPFIYLLGAEAANRRAGLFAVILAGIGYWPNVISRVGLRFPLYPLFAAATLYFLLRGLRRNSRNDFILAGLALGLGLHGYTPIRIMPFVILAAIGIYLIHRTSAGRRSQIILSLIILAMVALIAFLPLLRFSLDNPDLFSYRAFSRVGSIDQPLPGPAWQIFFSNLWRASTMYVWDDGDIWVISVPHRPLLDLVSGGLFVLGVVILLVRYIRKRNWVDIFLLVSIPLLMMPSILSLAFPAENPAVNRAAGALVPVFTIVGIAMDGFYETARSFRSQAAGRRFAVALSAVLIGFALLQNYDLVFNQYYKLYAQSSWNTDEMGEVIHTFDTTIGNADSAWVLGFPHWVDTRLVGLHAGLPTRDMAIFKETLPETLQVTGPKLFLVKPEDSEGLAALRQLYPDGWSEVYQSKYENKNFLMYFVPPGSNQG